MPTPYCEQFQAWLRTERKEEAPCAACAEASARRRQAEDYRQHVEHLEKAAETLILTAHPPPEPEEEAAA